jgi:hypothetical protein
MLDLLVKIILQLISAKNTLAKAQAAFTWKMPALAPVAA